MDNYQSEHSEKGLFVYEMYSAIKLHFTSNYDFFKYHGKTKSSVKNREDMNMFIQSKNFKLSVGLAKKIKTEDAIIEFLIANILKNNKIWLNDLLSDEAEDEWIKWKRTQNSLTYNFITDVKWILSNNLKFNSYLDATKGVPPILEFLLHDKIKIETVVIIDWLTGFLKQKVLKDKNFTIFSNIIINIEKYKPLFLHYHNFYDRDKLKFKKILLEKINIQKEQTENILPF